MIGLRCLYDRHDTRNTASTLFLENLITACLELPMTHSIVRFIRFEIAYISGNTINAIVKFLSM